MDTPAKETRQMLEETGATAVAKWNEGAEAASDHRTTMRDGGTSRFWRPGLRSIDMIKAHRL